MNDNSKNLNEILDDIVCDMAHEDDNIDYGEFNRSIADLVFLMLERDGHKVSNVEYGDTHYIFKTPKNSRISFDVEGTPPGWHFGLWIDSPILFRDNVGDDVAVVEVFAHHAWHAGAFTPEDSYLVALWTKKDFLSNMNYRFAPYDTFFGAGNLVTMVKRHPIAAYAWTGGRFYDENALPKFLEDAGKQSLKWADENVKLNAYRLWVKRKIKKIASDPNVTDYAVVDTPEISLSGTGRIQIGLVLQDGDTPESTIAKLTEHFEKLRFGTLHDGYSWKGYEPAVTVSAETESGRVFVFQDE